MEIDASPGGLGRHALSSSFNLGDFKDRLGSIDPRRSSPTALPPPPPLAEEDEGDVMQEEEAAAAAAEEQQQQQQEAAEQQQEGEEGVGCEAEEAVVDPEPLPVTEAEIKEELARAREAFMCRRWAAILRQARASAAANSNNDTGAGLGATIRAVAAAQQASEPSAEHLAQVFAAAEGDVRQLVAAFAEEEGRQAQAHEKLLARRAEVEALLGTLEGAQARLAAQEERHQRAQEQGEDAMDEQEEDGADGSDDAAEKEEAAAAEAEAAKLREALAAARSEGEAAGQQVASLEAKVAELKAKAEAEKKGVKAKGEDMGEEEDEDDDAGSMSTTGDEEELLDETARLQEHAEWVETLLATLQNLYGISAQITMEEDDAADAADAAESAKTTTLYMRLTYPSKHALELTLLAAAGHGAESGGGRSVRLAEAVVELPPQLARRKSAAVAEGARVLNAQAQALLATAKGLPAPEDIMFMAREVGWVIQGKGQLRAEVRELMRRFIVKHTESSLGAPGRDEVAVTYAHGVVATFSLLPGYPTMPGGVRIAGMTGVGGWRDSELAVTARSINGLGLDSLTALVESLHERLTEMDKNA